MKILVAYECSERIKKAFLDKGHDTYSCDYKPGELGLKNHYQCDVWELLNNRKFVSSLNMLIANPDCTTKANSGVRWLFKIHSRYEQMIKDCDEFNKLLRLPISKICVEQPIIHKYASSLIIKTYTQLIQPNYFGETESKATCLWLNGLPLLVRTHFLAKEDIKQSVWLESPSLNRKTNRARTFTKIAQAMAEQWT